MRQEDMLHKKLKTWRFYWKYTLYIWCGAEAVKHSSEIRDLCSTKLSLFWLYEILRPLLSFRFENLGSVTLDVRQVYVDIVDLSNDNYMIHAAKNSKMLKMNLEEEKIFFQVFWFQKYGKFCSISLDNFL